MASKPPERVVFEWLAEREAWLLLLTSCAVIGPPKHVIAVPLDITAVQGVHRGEILQRSWEMLGRPTPSSSAMLWYDMSPAGQQPRRDEIGAGRVFVGEGFVIFVGHLRQCNPTNLISAAA